MDFYNVKFPYFRVQSLSIDYELPHGKELDVIECGKCIKCKKEYRYGDYIMFVLLESGKIIWWHRRADLSVNYGSPCTRK